MIQNERLGYLFHLKFVLNTCFIFVLLSANHIAEFFHQQYLRKYLVTFIAFFTYI